MSARNGSAMAQLAALIGDETRARMLSSLMSGMALTATELAVEADVAASTASWHLSKLAGAGVLSIERQGRHKYFRILDAEVAEMLESLEGIATRGPSRVHPGPPDPALRAARVCYDHLAGARGVWLLDRLRDRKLLVGRSPHDVSPGGRDFFSRLGIHTDALGHGKRPLCRACLDWSERRHHLGGALGAALLDRMLALRWARRARGTRAVAFSAAGEQALRARFG